MTNPMPGFGEKSKFGANHIITTVFVPLLPLV
jgi:hypothetical protein